MSRKHFSIIASLLIGLYLPIMNAAAIGKSSPITSWSGAQLQSQAIKDRRTVADYFLAMPAQYLKVADDDYITASERQQLLTQAKQGKFGGIYDTKNGYLRLSRSSDLCGTYTLAVFKRSTGRSLVVYSLSCTMGDSLVILDPERNWQNVTTSVLFADLSPSPDASYITTIVLPRFGNTIEVYREVDRKQLMGRYRFDGNRFIKI